MLVLSHISPGIEAYRRMPAPSVSWCTQDYFNRVIENVKEGREMAQQLLTEMSALQAENARLLQQFETK